MILSYCDSACKESLSFTCNLDDYSMNPIALASFLICFAHRYS